MRKILCVEHKEGYYARQVNKTLFNWEWYSKQENVDWQNVAFYGEQYIPNKNDVEEMINSCTYSFIINGDTLGGLFTSKVNGNSIFFPVGGLFNNEKKMIISENSFKFGCIINVNKNYRKKLNVY